eukprot:62471-Amphidinium_carterae.1
MAVPSATASVVEAELSADLGEGGGSIPLLPTPKCTNPAMLNTNFPTVTKRYFPLALQIEATI